MSLAPGEQRTLAEIESRLRTSDPWLTSMFSLLSADKSRPVMRPATAGGMRPRGRARMIVLAALSVTLIAGCIVMAMHSASRAVPAGTGHSSGTSSVSVTARDAGAPHG